MKQRIHAEDNGPAFIPVKSKHRWSDKDRRPQEIIKVQAGSYVGEGHVVGFAGKVDRRSQAQRGEAIDGH